MKQIFISLLLSLMCTVAVAQYRVDSKITVRLYGGSVSPMGNANYVNGPYTAPSVFNNFKSGSVFGALGTYRFTKFVGANFKLTSASFSDWQYPNASDYKGATFSSVSASPQLVIYSPFREKGILSKLSISVFGGPSFNYNTLSLATGVHQPSTAIAKVDYNFIYSNAKCLGLSAGAGVEYFPSFRTTIGVFYSVDSQTVAEDRFESPTILYSSINLSLGFRFGLNTKFKYNP